jgi:hypothetical protein
VDATDPVEQPAALALQPPESTDDNIDNKRTTLSKATLSKIDNSETANLPTNYKEDTRSGNTG